MRLRVAVLRGRQQLADIAFPAGTTHPLAAGWDGTLPACVNASAAGAQAPSCTLSPVGPAVYSASKYTSTVGARGRLGGRVPGMHRAG